MSSSLYEQLGRTLSVPVISETLAGLVNAVTPCDLLMLMRVTDHYSVEMLGLWRGGTSEDPRAVKLREFLHHEDPFATALDSRTVLVQAACTAKLPIEQPSNTLQPYASVIVPLIADERVIGMLQAVKFSEPFPQQAIDLLMECMRPLSQALHNALTLRAAQDELTERRRAEAILRSQLMRLEIEKERELIELRERFLSFVSHELRTPLTVIFANADLLLRFHDRLTSLQQRTKLEETKKQVRGMVSLLDDVLHISRTSAGAVTCTPEPVNFELFVREALEQLQPLAQETHRLAYTGRGIPPRLMLDSRILSHIITNLLSNALKYSPNGGTIHLEAEFQDDHLIFSVSDQGIGVPEDEQDRLFEPFYRANNVEGITGTGLGLSIVKENVEVHGGSIRIESEVGVGTKFIVTVPTHTP